MSIRYFRVKDNPDPHPCSLTLRDDGSHGALAQGHTGPSADMIVETCGPLANGAFPVEGEQHYRWDGQSLHRTPTEE